MSAPQTDPERQVRQHRVPIYGTVILVILVLAGFLWWVSDETDHPEMPGETNIEEGAGNLSGQDMTTAPAIDEAAPPATDEAAPPAPADASSQ